MSHMACISSLPGIGIWPRQSVLCLQSAALLKGCHVAPGKHQAKDIYETSSSEPLFKTTTHQLNLKKYEEDEDGSTSEFSLNLASLIARVFPVERGVYLQNDHQITEG